MTSIGYWRWSALLSWLALFGLILIWVVWWSPPAPRFQAGALLIGLGPLVWFQRGMLAGDPKTHVAMSILASLYASHGSFELVMQELPLGVALLETVLASVLMVSAAFYARYQARYLKRQRAEAGL